MIITENVEINGRQFVRTYSNARRYVVRDGAEYYEAYDPVEFGRTYTEGELMPDEENEATAQDILDIILGGDSE